MHAMLPHWGPRGRRILNGFTGSTHLAGERWSPPLHPLRRPRASCRGYSVWREVRAVGVVRAPQPLAGRRACWPLGGRAAVGHSEVAQLMATQEGALLLRCMLFQCYCHDACVCHTPHSAGPPKRPCPSLTKLEQAGGRVEQRVSLCCDVEVTGSKLQ